MRDYVIGLYNASLDETRKLAGDIPASSFRSVVGGKNPAWLVGHLAIGSDFICSLCGAGSGLDAWGPLFAPGTNPDSNTAYPGKDELLGALEERHASALRALSDTSDAALAREFPIAEYRSFFPTVGSGVTYLLAAHEPYHNGQLQQWKLSHASR